jgi:hypothetical protein
MCPNRESHEKGDSAWTKGIMKRAIVLGQGSNGESNTARTKE